MSDLNYEEEAGSANSQTVAFTTTGALPVRVRFAFGFPVEIVCFEISCLGY
jgi:hypothetical protein